MLALQEVIKVHELQIRNSHSIKVNIAQNVLMSQYILLHITAKMHHNNFHGIGVITLLYNPWL